MMRCKILALMLFLTAVVSSPLMAQDSLDADAIKQKITGNTITIVTIDLKLATGLVGGDGTVRGHIGGDDFQGKWSIKDGDQLCFDLPDRSFDICRTVFEDGKHLNFFDASGAPGGRAEVLQGNPYGL